MTSCDNTVSAFVPLIPVQPARLPAYLKTASIATQMLTATAATILPFLINPFVYKELIQSPAAHAVAETKSKHASAAILRYAQKI